jgi:hypothetical protein
VTGARRKRGVRLAHARLLDGGPHPPVNAANAADLRRCGASPNRTRSREVLSAATGGLRKESTQVGEGK